MRKKVSAQIDNYFKSLGSAEAAAIEGLFRRQIRRLNIRYLNDSGLARDIDLVLRPWLVKPSEARLLHGIIYSFKAAHQKLFPLYFQNKAVREILPLRREEKAWFDLINRGSLQKYQVVFGRWDTNVTFSSREKLADLKFLETNTVGIGGIHYIPSVSEALRSIFKIKLEKQISPFRLGYQSDARCLLADEIKHHAKLIGRRGLNVAFIENREFLGGTVELPQLTKYFLKLGINAILADPRDLRLKKGEIYYRDICLDIIYRDSELQELIDLEKQGHGMQALKQAFMNNQVISSISGELDHKSGFEIFSSQEFLRFFSRNEQGIFRRHIPWTRILKQRYTMDENLRRVDLLPYTIKHQDKLIIKPNRAYGGQGVLIGKLAGKGQWQEYVNKAAKNPGDYVVQSFVKIRQDKYPYFGPGKEIEFDEFYSVSGFVVTARSIAVLGRFSKNMVVNVAKKGGIVPALTIMNA